MNAKVWVAYAASDQQFHIEVEFNAGMNVADAIAASGIEKLTSLPEPLSVGIFGTKIKALTHILESGDRVEIYRPLTINPKEIRRKRAAANPTSRYCRSNRFKQLY